MTDTETIEAIHAYLDEQPYDWVARLQLADLLESEGQNNEARYQRWAAQYQKAPLVRVHSSSVWDWYVKHKNYDRSPVATQASIGYLASTMRVHEYYYGFSSYGFSSRQDAENELLRQLVNCSWSAPTAGLT